MSDKTLCLQHGEAFTGRSIGADTDADGEVVFTTGMAGYLETLTDPSYYGQIIVFTFPLIGNYGVNERKELFAGLDRVYESGRIWARGVVVTEVSEAHSHIWSDTSLSEWLKEQNVPAITGVDTRAITRILREKGCVLGSLASRKPDTFADPLAGRYVPEVSPKEVQILEPENPIGKTVAFIDCGAKHGILRQFLLRGVRVIRCPFDTNPFALGEHFDGIFISNGPGDPQTCTETIEIVRQALAQDVPTFGICLGNQILALAAGGATRKMKYGHRGVNQPVKDIHTGKCIITSQNHGFEVDADTLPDDWEVWMRNLNDDSVEGIRHKEKPFFSVQFHPEACPGPEDARYLFDAFLKSIS